MSVLLRRGVLSSALSGEVPMILGITSHTDNTFQLKFQNAATAVTIDWGDSTSDVITTYNQAELDHTYPSASTNYDITIYGQFGGLRYAAAGDRLLVKEMKQWGTTVWSSMEVAFQYCENFIVTATDVPDVSAVTVFSNAFGKTAWSNPDLSGWDCSAGVNFTAMWSESNGTGTLNLTNVVTSSATTLTSMIEYSDFSSVTVTGWDCANVNTMYRFARSAKVTSLNYSNLVFGVNVNWEEMCVNCTLMTTFTKPTTTPSITSLYFAFYNTALSGTIDLTDLCSTTTTTIGYCLSNNASLTTAITTGWDTSNVTNVSNFISYSGITTIGLADMNMEAVTSTTNFATGTTLSTATYDAALIAWDAQNLVDSLTWNFGSSTYTGGGAAEAARSSLISTDSLTILDGGAI